MSSDPASLDNLRDIVKPAAVPWWPPAIGWWMLLGLSLLAFAVVAYRAYRHWQANAYRRAALSEIRSATTAAQISEILKRTALAAFPRADVASLCGDAWCEWLGDTSGIGLNESIRRCLTRGIFRDTDAATTGQLQEFAAQWIRAHKNPSEDLKRGKGLR